MNCVKRLASLQGLLFYKALLSIPMLLVLAYASPEVSQALAYPGLRKTSFQVMVARSRHLTNHASRMNPT